MAVPGPHTETHRACSVAEPSWMVPTTSKVFLGSSLGSGSEAHRVPFPSPAMSALFHTHTPYRHFCRVGIRLISGHKHSMTHRSPASCWRARPRRRRTGCAAFANIHRYLSPCYRGRKNSVDTLGRVRPGRAHGANGDMLPMDWGHDGSARCASRFAASIGRAGFAS